LRNLTGDRGDHVQAEGSALDGGLDFGVKLLFEPGDTFSVGHTVLPLCSSYDSEPRNDSGFRRQVGFLQWLNGNFPGHRSVNVTRVFEKNPIEPGLDGETSEPAKLFRIAV
jgi:hypothetical protein